MLFAQRTNERGFTTIELVLVVVIIGVLANLAVHRYLSTRDQARIAVATYDLQLFQKALGIYETDHSHYPPWDRDALERLIQDLIDINGQHYIDLPGGKNFTEFHYSSRLNGQSYLITIRALDRNETRVLADPTRTWIEREPRQTGGQPTSPLPVPSGQEGAGGRFSGGTRAQHNP